MENYYENLFNMFKEILGLKESPIGVYYSNDKPEGITPDEGGHTCIFRFLQNVRKKRETVYFDKNHFGCPGGAYYMGFRETPRPNIEYFLSYGIPGEMEGERYIKTPELAREYFKNMKPRPAPANFCIFKPLEKFKPNEVPEVIIFFTTPDILSGLFTLTNYALERTDAILTPFGSGCSTILTYPLKNKESSKPHAFIGMFDVSARPMVESDIVTLSMSYSIFTKLLENVSGSFLETESWKKILHRIQGKIHS